MKALLCLALVFIVQLARADPYGYCLTCGSLYCDPNDGTDGTCGTCAVGCYSCTQYYGGSCPNDLTGLSTAIITVIIICSIVACVIFVFLPIACCLGWLTCFTAGNRTYTQQQVAVIQTQPAMMGEQPRVVTCGSCNNQLLIAPATPVGSLMQCTHCSAQFAVPANAPVYQPPVLMSQGTKTV